MTYMFVHVGIMHIMMNLVVQLFLGTALELVHCWWRVALVYLSGVLAGSMGTSIANPRIYLAGASGGVYALITAHIATIILNWKEMEYAGELMNIANLLDDFNSFVMFSCSHSTSRVCGLLFN